MAHFEEIKQFVLITQPAVMCLTETHLIKDINDFEVQIQNYVTVRVDSHTRHTGGVKMYIREDLNYSVDQEYVKVMSYWVLFVKLQINKSKVLLGCLYRSPSGSEADFMLFFEEVCENYLVNQKQTILLMGDFNINYNKNFTYANRLKKCLADYGFTQHINEFTHITPEGRESLIDLVISNSKEITCNVLRQPVFNNHSLIKVTINELKDKAINLVVRKKLVDFNGFKAKISSMTIDYRIKDINSKYKCYYENILNIIDEFMPRHIINVKCKSSNWFNDELRSIIKIRDQKYRTFLITKENRDWKEYKKFRNLTVSRIREVKRMHYEEIKDNNKHDSVKLWKCLKNIMSGNKSETLNEIECNGIMYTSKEDIVEQFNCYYIDSIIEIVNSIPNPNVVEHFNIIEPTFNCFKLVDEDSLRKIVFSLPSKSSPDDVTIELYKICFDEIKSILLHLVNSSLESGIVPEKLKISTIVPIKKVNNAKKAEQFRPINMLPAIAKILEKIVYVQLVNYVQENNLLNNYQSGFRQHHNCETAFQYILNDWKENIDMDLITAVIFLDFKRAFETINRERMILKLRMLGLGNTVSKWFYNYLDAREQNVKCDSIISTNKQVEHGIPQGSILGPLLFILYINDIDKTIKNCKYHMFADDTILYIAGTDKEDLQSKINEDTSNLIMWLQNNKLKLNNEKTKVMMLGKHITIEEWKTNGFNITLEGQIIEIVEVLKYLGILVDRNLKFSFHADYICKKVSKKLGVLYRCSHYLSYWAKRTVYNSIIQPHFQFGGTVLSLINSCDMGRLQILQNRAMRIILKCDKSTSINHMLRALNFFNVKDMCEINAMIFLHKIKLGLMPQYFNNILVTFSEIHSYNTRFKECYAVGIKKYKKTQNSLFYKFVVKYNSLPSELKSCNLSMFKGRIKSMFNYV